MEVYDTEKDSWAIAPPLALAKAWVGACEMSGRLYVMGGANYDDGKKAYIWRDEMEAYVPEVGKREHRTSNIEHRIRNVQLSTINGQRSTGRSRSVLAAQ